MYGTILDHKWIKHHNDLVDGTKLDPPFFELCVNWRAAVNTHAFPWMMAASLNSFWTSYAKHVGFVPKFVRLMPAEIARRMGDKLNNMGRKRLAEVVQELADELNKSMADDPDLKLSKEEIWQSFFGGHENWEFRLAIWGSQRLCFGALYHAYEAFCRHALAIKTINPAYRITTFKKFQDDMAKAFDVALADSILGGKFINISRIVRNCLAHAGGKENGELKKIPGHGIPVETGTCKSWQNITSVLFGTLRFVSPY